MKSAISIFFSLFTVITFGQDYSFAKDFVNGTIILKDGTQKSGQIKWFPSQNDKLKFRESENGKTTKYSPEEVAGFNTDTLKFVSLLNFEVYAENYGLLGKPSKIKRIFGQLLDSGSYNIYLIFPIGYNALGGTIQTYPNFLFEKKADSSYQYAAYPFTIRMKDKRYEQAKENLYSFFKDYPQVIDKIRSYKQQEDFFEIIKFMESIN